MENKLENDIEQENLKQVGYLLSHLSIERSINYSLWINLGKVLYTINYILLDEWIKFSKKCTKKFIEGECEKIWYKFDKSTIFNSSEKIINKCIYGVNTLYEWVLEDNYSAAIILKELMENQKIYKNLTENKINKLIKKAIISNRRN